MNHLEVEVVYTLLGVTSGSVPCLEYLECGDADVDVDDDDNGRWAPWSSFRDLTTVNCNPGQHHLILILILILFLILTSSHPHCYYYHNCIVPAPTARNDHDLSRLPYQAILHFKTTGTRREQAPSDSILAWLVAEHPVLLLSSEARNGPPVETLHSS